LTDFRNARQWPLATARGETPHAETWNWIPQYRYRIGPKIGIDFSESATHRFKEIQRP